MVRPADLACPIQGAWQQVGAQARPACARPGARYVFLSRQQTCLVAMRVTTPLCLVAMHVAAWCCLVALHSHARVLGGLTKPLHWASAHIPALAFTWTPGIHLNPLAPQEHSLWFLFWTSPTRC